MLNREQTQQAGDYSVNNQAQTITQHITIVQGVTPEQAKEISLQVYKDNMPTLAAEARALADQRANELTNKLIDTMIKQSSELLNAFRDPDMQYSLVKAQIAHARIGDNDIADILIDTLVERALQSQRSLQQIVLNEVLTVLPKLTAQQIDIMTIAFVIQLNHRQDIYVLPQLKDHFEKTLKPLAQGLTTQTAPYKHLAYTGCASISMGEIAFEACIKEFYKPLFHSGVPRRNFAQIEGWEAIQRFLHPASDVDDSDLVRLVPLDDKLLEGYLKTIIPDESTRNQLMTLNASGYINTFEIKERLLKLCPWISDFIDCWDNSHLKNLELTSVGIAIAITNLRRKTNEKYDLGIWIK